MLAENIASKTDAAMPMTEIEAHHPSRSQCLQARFEAFITDKTFPCVGAKSAHGRGLMRFIVAQDLLSDRDDVVIHERLTAFAGAYRKQPDLFQTCIVLFHDPAGVAEEVFENGLWDRVQALSNLDAGVGFSHDDRVSTDPENPHFSLSFGGEAFFVVGLHPGASRPARRFDFCALVFNPHEQFEQLRREGRYEKLRESILARDVVLAGSANPMLARHGEGIEAAQYSGRIVEEGWTCPFSPPQRNGLAPEE